MSTRSKGRVQTELKLKVKFVLPTSLIQRNVLNSKGDMCNKIVCVFTSSQLVCINDTIGVNRVILMCLTRGTWAIYAENNSQIHLGLSIVFLFVFFRWKLTLPSTAYSSVTWVLKSKEMQILCIEVVNSSAQNMLHSLYSSLGLCFVVYAMEKGT